MTEYRRCPRCNARLFEVGRGASSRATRDEGAEIEVCGRCGLRESLYGYGDPTRFPPYSEWPLNPRQLADEEFRLITDEQRGKIRLMSVSPEDAARWLDRGLGEGEES